jgi:hydroxymethylglutaryl-CoA synthase
LFNAINWVESSSWDGRNAIVFCGDIAVYAEGAARPAGGAGACAMLIGPNAPLVFERELFWFFAIVNIAADGKAHQAIHGTYMANTYDFYKPRMEQEYPVVDGPLSVATYLAALDGSYSAFRQKYAKYMAPRKSLSSNGAVNGHARKVSKEVAANGHSNGNGVTANGNGVAHDSKADVSLDDFDYHVFHSPYGKQVQKGLARLVKPSFTPLIVAECSPLQLYNDFVSNPSKPIFSTVPSPSELLALPYEATLTDKSIEKTFVAISKSLYKTAVEPSMACSKRCGNMYTGSLYGGLASLVATVPSDDLIGKRISMFAYGSGCASSFFVIRVKGSTAVIAETMDLLTRLQNMKVVPCTEYVEAMNVRSRKLSQLIALANFHIRTASREEPQRRQLYTSRRAR